MHKGKHDLLVYINILPETLSDLINNKQKYHRDIAIAAEDFLNPGDVSKDFKV